MKAPCYKCEQLHVNCHDNCLKYKEYRKEREEWSDGKLKVVKVPERAEEQYSFLLKDVFGNQTTVFVTKEEYKQFEIGDKYRR